MPSVNTLTAGILTVFDDDVRCVKTPTAKHEETDNSGAVWRQQLETMTLMIAGAIKTPTARDAEDNRGVGRCFWETPIAISPTSSERRWYLLGESSKRG